MAQQDGAEGTTPPETVRQLQTPAALALADLTAIFEDLTKVVACCENILSELHDGPGAADEVTIEALWTTALVSYRRCFSAGKHSVGLSKQDLADTKLEGDLEQWHKTLEKLRNYYVDTRVNPRENFAVGAVQDTDGRATGIAISAAPQPQPDQTTVQQTGQLALELSRLVDERIKTQQETVYTAAREMTVEQLARLPLVYLTTPDITSSTTADATDQEPHSP